jgi:hypothetical protein
MQYINILQSFLPVWVSDRLDVDKPEGNLSDLVGQCGREREE